MEKDALALAGAIAGFVAAILTIIDRLITLRERAAAAARAAAARAAGADDEEDEQISPKPKGARTPRRRWWTLRWPDWIGPAPAHLILRELAVICGAGILLNSLGLLLSLRLESILFLDMVGTAFAAFLLGPWWGAATALLTNSLVNWLLYPQHDPDLLIFPWTLVNMAGGFYWGVLARTGWFRGYLQSGHTSVFPHMTFLILFGGLGACVMSVPGAFVQSVVSHTTATTLNPTLVAALQILVDDWQSFVADQFGLVLADDATEGLGAFFLAWAHTCFLYIPDKVVSVAIAMTLARRGYPVFEEELVIGPPSVDPPSDNRLAPLVLGLLYMPVFAVLISADTYLAGTYWPLWGAPWLFVAGGYVWLRRRGPVEETLRVARLDRAARYREQWHPIQKQPTSSFCQRLTVGWLIASAIFAVFMPVMLDDYSNVAFNFFCLVYGSMLGIHLMRISVVQNVYAANRRETPEDEVTGHPRRRRPHAA